MRRPHRAKARPSIARPISQLTQLELLNLLLEYAAGKTKVKDVAERYGISPAAVCSYARGKQIERVGGRSRHYAR